MARSCAIAALSALVPTMACGLDLAGASQPSQDAGVAAPGGDDASGTPRAPDRATEDAAVTSSCAQPSLTDCGGCNNACPAGTDACVDGKCIASVTVAVHIDGYDDLLIEGNTIRWHHLTWATPGPTTIDGVAWTPKWPPKPADCKSCGDPGPGANVCACTSTDAASLAPPLAKRDHDATVQKIAGRGDVTIVEQPRTANAHRLVVRFSDGEEKGADYTARVTYETR
jgi:hypothetical protein